MTAQTAPNTPGHLQGQGQGQINNVANNGLNGGVRNNFKYYDVDGLGTIPEKVMNFFVLMYSNPSLFTTLAFYEYPYLRGNFTKVAW